MFATHQARIETYARQSPDNLARVIQFVILTVRQPLSRIPGDMEIVDRGGDEAMSILFGWKNAALLQVWAERERTHSYCEHIVESDASDRSKSAALLEHLGGLHGFGLAKAGFVVQLAYGLAGCLDTHNLTRFGLPKRAFRDFKLLKSSAARRHAIARYLTACEDAGGCAALWDSWCEYVAAQYPTIYPSAWEVSALHCRALGLRED